MLLSLVVVRTGDHTLIGQIAALTGGESGNKSPLSREMYVSILFSLELRITGGCSANFVVYISTIAICFAIIFFVRRFLHINF